MKKIISVISIVMLFVASVASCHKEEPVKSPPVFTATVNTTATRTTIDASNGKVSWESTDEITITDGSGKRATYIIKSIDSKTGKATFTVKSGQPTLGNGPYTAIYGELPKTEQYYRETPGGLYMTATSSTLSLKFTVGCGLMELKLTKSGEEVKKIEVTGTNNTAYTLNCPDVVDISTQKPFYIAVPEGKYTKIVITDANNNFCNLTSNAGVPIDNNKITPVTLGDGKLYFALPGEFSVGAGKKVRFSQGNLYWTGSAFEFEKDQFSYPTAWNTNYVGHFYWTKTAIKAYQQSYEDSGADGNDVLFTNNSDFTVKVWRTLKMDEWKYLLFETSSDRNGKYLCPVEVKGKGSGLVIAPDLFSGSIKPSYTADEWKDAEKEHGLVFLPKAGTRKVSDINSQEAGHYWCSTTSGGPQVADYFTITDDFDDENFMDGGDRGTGRSIRLVRDVN
ncbi:MAG: hypothetical protein MJY53_00960 [Bacteroidales bacterium]|nr:hypothetical protein [Bacteroidales bacterium]